MSILRIAFIHVIRGCGTIEALRHVHVVSHQNLAQWSTLWRVPLHFCCY